MAFTVQLPDVGDPAGPDAIASLIAAVKELREQVTAQGGATPAAGSITTAMLADGAVTNAKLADGAVAGRKIASGVIPAAPTADTLSGATVTGRALLKATDAAAARTAIGAAAQATGA